MDSLNKAPEEALCISSPSFRRNFTQDHHHLSSSLITFYCYYCFNSTLLTEHYINLTVDTLIYTLSPLHLLKSLLSTTLLERRS